VQAKFVVDINQELAKLRTSCGVILGYDWISLPLVYTQVEQHSMRKRIYSLCDMLFKVVAVAVYCFFAVTLFGRQWMEVGADTPNQYDYVFPLFTSLQFIVYVGWLKVLVPVLLLDTNYG
jgi:predicted permease